MSSSAAHLDDERAARERARAAERARQYRLGQRQKSERMRAEIAASRGLISWQDIAPVSFQAPPLPGPTRTCQWIEKAGGFGSTPEFCDAPCKPGRSYCKAHARVVFATAART